MNWGRATWRLEMENRVLRHAEDDKLASTI
ncbi:hypothetical protein AVEN_82739-1, partial [Araneus ventricosus]